MYITLFLPNFVYILSNKSNKISFALHSTNKQNIKRKKKADANERRKAPSGTCPEGPNYDIPKITGG